MNTFLSHLLADLRKARLTRRGATHHPDAVPRGLHKKYARMPAFVLPEPQVLNISLTETLLHRQSCLVRTYPQSLSMSDFGTLLGSALRKRAGTTSRNYPSGGALFPCETYLFANGMIDGPGGIFHYNPSSHSLERLWDFPAKFDIKSLAPSPDGLIFSSLLVFTSVWNRSSAKYGDLTFLHALLEAGHMSENVLLTATAMNIAARPMAGFNDDLIVKLLDLDELEEQPVHSIVLGKTASSAATSSGPSSRNDTL